MASRWFYLTLMLSLCFVAHRTKAAGEEDEPTYWFKRSQDELNAAVNAAKGHNKNRADGVILFIGDGMSVATVTGVRIYKGQKDGKLGGESELAYDKFPNLGYSKTYNTNSQVPDSAGTATGYMTGVKTKRRVLGLDAGIEVGNCASTKGHEVDSFLVQAKNQGMPVGIVTTTRITHASPAGAYAHSPERDWESDDDKELPAEAKKNGCKDIAWQLIHDNEFDVVMGGGRQRFMTTSQRDPKYTSAPGKRIDEDLIGYWKNRYGQIGRADYVYNREQFMAIDPDETDFLLGLFAISEMNFDLENTGDEPTLAEMTEKAIKILQRKSTDGRFALFIEGGRIDHGHHLTQAKRAISDGLALEQAIAKAKSITSDNTLIVLSSDHGHTMSMAGYAPRELSLFGKMYSDGKGLPYTSLGYYTGQDAKVVYLELRSEEHRPDISKVDTDDLKYNQQAFVPSLYETHGGEDVGIFATGPWSHLIHSVHEQNYIPHVLMYAGCIGQYAATCLEPPPVNIATRSFGGVHGAVIPARFRARPPPVAQPEPGDGSGASSLTAKATSTVLFVLLLAKRLF